MAVTLVQVDFPHQGPCGAEMAQAFEGLAQSIAGEPGFLFKSFRLNNVIMPRRRRFSCLVAA